MTFMFAQTPDLPPLDLDSLNDAQREAVCTTEGPVLVLAGAGTGKTRVLTTRIAHILQQNLAFPSQILAVTFTNKAAKEMQHRLEAMVGDYAKGLWIGTFHSLALRMLRSHHERVGLPSSFEVVDADDQVRLIKTILNEEQLDVKEHPPMMLSNQIQSWKDKGFFPHDIEDTSVAAKIYPLYQQRLQTLGACDFGDLLLLSYTLLKDHPEVLEQYHRKFRYMLVDEYQDTNVIQYLWLRLLAQGSKNICCVGDDDQSIYGWRGAEVENILRFEKDFDGSHIVRLECNYRSTSHILGVASQLISNNKGRLGKTLYTEDNEGEKVQLINLWDDRSEAQYVAAQIQERRTQRDLPLRECAVLVRAGHQTRAFEECFLSTNVPYRIIGGLRFYDRKEIRDAIAYIRTALFPQNDLAFERIINTPKRGLGDASMQKLRDYAREHGYSLFNAIAPACDEGLFKGKTLTTLSLFTQQCERWKELLSGDDFTEQLLPILEESGYMAMLRRENSAQSQGRIDNLKELVNALGEFESIQEFLEHVSLVADNDGDDSSDMVNVITMHGAKGLEFDTVFLVGWEEKLFPSERAIDEQGNKGLEEERRLAYVGVTRARKSLTISFCANRFMYGQTSQAIPSRFIDELPKEHVEIVNAQIHGGAAGFSSASRGHTISDSGPAKAQHRFKSRSKKSTTAKYAEGDQVFHHKFGGGTVTKTVGKHITVRFSRSGDVRTLMEDFLQKKG